MNDLPSVLDMEVIRSPRLKVGVDPLGGASIGFLAPIAERYGIDIEVANDTVDPTFGFRSLDWDGRVRMDGSSRCTRAPLVGLEDRLDIAFGNDPDADRHSIVTRGGGLMNRQWRALQDSAQRLARTAGELRCHTAGLQSSGEMR